MTRREFGLAALAAGSASAQTRYPGTRYREYSRCLPDYLRGLAAAAYKTRKAALNALAAPAEIEARQRWARETLWRLIGGRPERIPLDIQTTGSFQRQAYRVDKIVYQSRPGIFVTANFYIPDSGSPPYPGVLFQMGHSLNGKANAGYQECCQGLARLGYVVLAFDPMGQGERTYYPGANGLTRFGDADEEHTYPGKQMLLVGNTATRFQLWDAVRSLDVLAAHPQVDSKRLASTGQSGGGTLTMLLACADDRLAAAAVASGNTENFACADFDPPGSTDDAEQDFINSGPAGFDRWDLLYPMAPKPLLILVSDKDFFGTYSPRYISNGWEEYQNLARVYAALGHPDRLAWEDTPLPHGLAYYSRLRIYNWFERWLKHSTTVIREEPTVSPEPDRQLWAGGTGNAVHDFGSKTPFDLVRERAAEIKTPGRPAALENLLNIDRIPTASKLSVLGAVPSHDIEIQAAEVQSAEQVWVPVWMFRPKSPKPGKPIVLILDAGGRNRHWREDGLGEQLASRGHMVCAADLRGIGDLRPEAGRGAPGYTLPHDSEEAFAWASLILGHPLLGQRAADILALVAALRHFGPVNVAANGRLTLPALFAAALSPDIASLYLSAGISSLRAIVETENYNQPLANFVFDVLAHTDLPQLANAIAPRRVHLAGTLDAAGKSMPLDALRRIYPFQNVTLSQETGWNEEALLEVFA